MDDTLALTPHLAARLTPASCRHSGTRQGFVATWRERIRLRWELRRMLAGDPHLIDDIGLTRRQVEAEIAKPFWQR